MLLNSCLLLFEFLVQGLNGGQRHTAFIDWSDMLFVGAEPEVSRFRVRATSASQALARDWMNHLPSVYAVLSNAEPASRLRMRSARIECACLPAAATMAISFDGPR